MHHFFVRLLAAACLLTPLAGQIDQGPGGPILVIASSANPFGRYFAEILRAEGLNEFAVADISSVSASALAAYDVVILGEMALTSGQASMLTSWVSGGGNLIAMRPDQQLAAALGISYAGSSRAEGYLLVNTSAAPGLGIVNETMQYHGAADLYALNGATSLATLYADAGTITSNPAVTLRGYGSGQIGAFTYDLAKSVVYSRQGNPAWAGRTGCPGNSTGAPTTCELFYPGWTNPAKAHIPQADEQIRLLANMILHMNRTKKPLPRFWYLPFAKKFAVVMTSDDHNGADTANRYQLLSNISPAGCNVANWECARASAFVYSNNPIGNASFANWQAQGFDTSLHFVIPARAIQVTIDSAVSSQMASFTAAFPSLNRPSTTRIHTATWPDWVTQAKEMAVFGIRMDHTYQQDPYAYFNANPGFYTASAMLMRYADANGAMYDIYQAPTQIWDGTGENLPSWPNPIFDRGVGAQGFYGFVSVLVHSDYTWQDAAAVGIAQNALARGIPVISSRQALTWTDGRNNSSFSGLAWNGSNLNFNVNAASGSNGLRGMLPYSSAAGNLRALTQGGSNVSYTVQTIKGVDYAFFSATGGAFVASYGTGSVATPLQVTATSPANGDTNVSNSPVVTATFSRAVQPGSVNSSSVYLRNTSSGSVVPASLSVAGANVSLVPSSILAPGTVYSGTLTTAITDTAGVAIANNHVWSFATAAGSSSPPAVSSTNPSAGAVGVAVGVAPSVTFNRNMNAASFGSSTFSLRVNGASSDTGGSISVSGATAIFTPFSPLAANTTYRVSVAAGVTDAGGVALGTSYSFTFTTAGTVVPPSGSPVGYWAFDQGAGTTAIDGSGNNNSGTLNGATWAAGKTGAALNFNGAGASVDFGSPAALANLGSFTWGLWANPAGDPGRGYGPAMEKGTGSTQIKTLTFGPATGSSPGKITALVRAAGVNAYSETNVNTYAVGVWNHWAVIYDDSGDRRIHIYRDGVEVSYVTQTAASGTLTPDAGYGLSFGATAGNGYYSFNGRLDEIKIFNRALSAAEVLALAQGGSSSPPPTVSSTTPAHGASGVAITTGVTVNFSRAMNPASFNSSTFTVSGVGGSISASGASATFTPFSPLVAGTTYTATVGATVTDASGIALGSGYSFAFTTQAASAPVVTGSSPGNGATGVPTNTSVSVTFSRSMNPGSFNTTTFALPGASGSVSVSGATATFTPSAALAAGATYTAAISPGVTDTNGVALGSGYSFSFSTASSGGGPAGLAGYWAFEQGGGSVALDTTANANSGVLNGATWTTGRSGGGLNFPTNASVSLGSPAALSNLPSFTWSVWVNAAGEPGRGFGPVIEKGAGSDQRKSLSFGTTASSGPFKVTALVKAGGANAYSETVSGSYSLNTWMHWAITYDDSGDRRVHIYRNGVEVAYAAQNTAAGALAADSGLELAVGATPGGAYYSFNGKLDEVKIFSRALSASEVLALAQQ